MPEISGKLDNVKFEDALDIAGYGRFNMYMILLTGLILGTGILSSMDVGFLLPAAECDLHLDSADKGLLGSAYFFGIILSSFVAGFLADTLGRRYVILRGAGLNVFVYIVGSIASNFWTLFAVKLISGILTSPCMIAAFPFLGEYIPAKQRSKSLLLASALSSLTTVYYACVGLLVLRDDWRMDLGLLVFTPWRLFFLLCGLPSLCCFLLLLVTPESPKFLLIRGQKAASIKVLQRVASVNNSTIRPQDFIVRSISVDAGETVPPKREKGALGVLKNIFDQTLPLFQPPHARSMLSCMLFYIMALCSINSISLWTPEFVERMIKYKSEHDGTFFSCEMIGRPEPKIITDLNQSLNTTVAECHSALNTEIFLPNLVIGTVLPIFLFTSSAIISHVDIRFCMMALLFLCAAMTYSVTLIPNIYVIITLLAGTIIFGTIACNILRGVNVELFPTYIRAMAISMNMVCARIGSIIGSQITSRLVDHHCGTLFVLIAGLFVGCAVIPLSLKLKKKTKASETSVSSVG